MQLARKGIRPAAALWQVIMAAGSLPFGGGAGVVPIVDLRLLLRVRLGDPLAQEAYVHALWPDVERSAGHYASRGGPREDLAAEGALALWEAAFSYDPRRHRTDPATFARNAIQRRMRRVYRAALGYDRDAANVVPLHGELPARGADPLEAVDQRIDIARDISRLPSRDRRVVAAYVALVDREGLGPDEAAARLAERFGRTKDAVKKQVQRARRRLRTLV